jgi:DNA-binding response OmpR family regulator
MTKIMIVDDEPDLRDMLNLMLQNEGFETALVNDGTDFLNKVDDFQPDLVILDVMMPGLTIGEILEQLKSKHCVPKIILLTVVRFPEDERKKMFELGNIVDYIKKPFDMDEFLERVRKQLD